MKRISGFIIILAMTFVLLGLQGQSKVFACHVNCPYEAVDLGDPINGEYTFTYKLDLCTFKWQEKVSIQMDANIPCEGGGDDFPQPCSNIEVLLDNAPIPYIVLSPKEVIGSCRSVNTYPGPRPSYVIEAFLKNAEVRSNYNCDTDEDNVSTPVMPELNLKVKTSKELAWGNGNVVISYGSDLCKGCDYKVPVVVNELGTLRQGIKLKPDCTVYYRFDAEGNPLPAKRSDIKGECEGLKGISRPFANNEIALRILRNPQDTEKADAIVSENYSRDFIINFVKTTTTNSIPFSLKTGDDSQYWYYLPGYGWQVIYY
jgi:hypothetical protein